MIVTRTTPRGFTFVELLLALVVLAILCALALPNFRDQVNRMRARSALDHLVAEVYRARMAAVESGGPTHLFLQAGADGCVRGFRFVAPRQSSERSGRFGADLPGLCLRHSGDSILIFNNRGMLRPPARSLRITYGTFTDSVLLSTSGRVRRAYRRNCR